MSVPQKLSNFIGKIVILDFWSTGCTSCVLSMPKIDSIQKQFGDKVQVFMVTEQSEQEIIAAFKGRPAKLKMWFETLPFIVGDTILKRYFKHISLPHIIWIDEKGKVDGITLGKYLTKQNVALKVSGNLLSLPVKLDVSVDQDLVTISEEYKQAITSENIFYSAITKDIQGANNADFNKSDLAVDSSRKTVKYTKINQSLLDLYLQSVSYSETHSFSNKVILDVDEANRRKLDSKFCYEALVPLGTTKQELMEYMRSDLNRYFNLNGRVEKRLINCLSLEKTGNEEITKSDTAIINREIKKETLTPLSIANFVQLMNAYGNPLTIDNSGLNSYTELKINIENWSDIPSIRKKLNKVGYDLISVAKEVELLVIEQKNHRQSVTLN